jgi:hypothetical protein
MAVFSTAAPSDRVRILNAAVVVRIYFQLVEKHKKT